MKKCHFPKSLAVPRGSSWIRQDALITGSDPIVRAKQPPPQVPCLGRKHIPWFITRGLSVASISIVLAVPLGCVTQEKKAAFSVVKCNETIPGEVEGLVILTGPRSPKSIIRDMRQAECGARARFYRQYAGKRPAAQSSVVLRVVVEYTGEVQEVKVKEKRGLSDDFLSEICNMVHDTDFVYWGRNDQDTVFLYPIDFGI